MASGLAKKMGNTCISQDGGTFWLFPGITGISWEILGNKVQLHTNTSCLVLIKPIVM